MHRFADELLILMHPAQRFHDGKCTRRINDKRAYLRIRCLQRLVFVFGWHASYVVHELAYHF
jgi:hypothetical protein